MNRNSLKQAGLILIFLAAGMAAGIQAQPGRGGNRGGRGMQHRPMMGEFQQRDSIREQYKLTDEQREKMAKLRKEHQAEMQKLRDKFRKETEKILTPEQLDMAKKIRAHRGQFPGQGFYGPQGPRFRESWRNGPRGPRGHQFRNPGPECPCKR